MDAVEEKAEGSRWNTTGFSSPRWKEGNAGWEGQLAGRGAASAKPLASGHWAEPSLATTLLLSCTQSDLCFVIW